MNAANESKKQTVISKIPFMVTTSHTSKTKSTTSDLESCAALLKFFERSQPGFFDAVFFLLTEPNFTDPAEHLYSCISVQQDSKLGSSELKASTLTT